MFADTVKDLAELADLGVVPAHPVWLARADRLVHWTTECRAAALTVLESINLAELAGADDVASLQECDHCQANSAPVREALADLHPGVAVWVSSAQMWLASDHNPVERHGMLLVVSAVGRAYAPGRDRDAVAAVMGRLELALDAGRSRGAERRARWETAAQAATWWQLGPARDTEDEAGCGASPEDLNMAKAYQLWSWENQHRPYNQRDTPLCPFELADLDDLVERLLATKAWALIPVPSLSYGSSTSGPCAMLMFADVVVAYEPGTLLVRLPALTIAPDPGRSLTQPLLGRDHGFDVADVVLAAPVARSGVPFSKAVQVIRDARTLCMT